MNDQHWTSVWGNAVSVAENRPERPEEVVRVMQEEARKELRMQVPPETEKSRR